MTKLRSVARIAKKVLLMALVTVVGAVVIAYLLLLGSGDARI